MTTLRLFISVNLPPELLASLESMQRQLVRRLADAPLRWVRPEGIHLTLKFLGETEQGRVQEIVSGLREAVSTHLPFECHVGGLGCFPSLRNPSVIWVGVADPEERLARLAADVDQAMAGLGWQRERRAFTGHLTLARVKKQAKRGERRALGEQFSALKMAADLGALPVHSIHLMRSQLLRDGARYSSLAEISLVGE